MSEFHQAWGGVTTPRSVGLGGAARIHVVDAVASVEIDAVHLDRPFKGVAGNPLDDADTATRRLLEDLSLRRPSRYERFVKPVMDRITGVVLLLLATPVLLVIALLVWVNLGTPVLIRQNRIGRGGRRFAMFKFRTMRPDRRRWADPNYSGPERRMTHKSPHDPRHTSIGLKLRRSSLDELPQLLNVVRGDMSIVGPRPELQQVVAEYREWQHMRHLVRPGLTGLWQITERANGTLMHEHTELDLTYIQHLSARTDLGILCRTPIALLKKEQVH